MSDKTLQFRLVSPEAELMSEMVTDVSAPGTEGDFGVKPGHMAMVSTLRPGIVVAKAPHNPNPVRYFISGGFADVNASSCTILAEQAIDVLQLNAGKVKAEIDQLVSRLAMPLDEVTAATLRAELGLAQARLAAANSN